MGVCVIDRIQPQAAPRASESQTQWSLATPRRSPAVSSQCSAPAKRCSTERPSRTTQGHRRQLGARRSGSTAAPTPRLAPASPSSARLEFLLCGRAVWIIRTPRQSRSRTTQRCSRSLPPQACHRLTRTQTDRRTCGAAGFATTVCCCVIHHLGCIIAYLRSACLRRSLRSPLMNAHMSPTVVLRCT